VQERLRDAGLAVEVRELADSTRTAAEAAAAVGAEIVKSPGFVADGEPAASTRSGARPEPRTRSSRRGSTRCSRRSRKPPSKTWPSR